MPTKIRDAFQKIFRKAVYSFALVCVFTAGASSALRRRMWRWWYGKLARQISDGDWTFMNYGFAVLSEVLGKEFASEFAPKSIPEKTLALDPEDEADRFCIQLYEHVVAPADLSGKEVLEVSSGRGGGASYLTRYHHPKKYTGMDFSPEAVAFSTHRHQEVKNLRFVAGDAEQMPFPDGSFDVVINVESSHCYGSTEKFIREAVRLLRPGGFFLFADLRGASEMAELKALFAAQPLLRLIEEENITPNVMAALRADDQRKRGMIGKLVRPSLQPVFEEFAGVMGGKIFQELQKGNLQYMRFAFQHRE